MLPTHNLLQRQLKKLDIETAEHAPSAEQWRQFLDHVNRSYTEADQERYLLEHSQKISSNEMQGLYSRLEEAQRIACLGNWSFERIERKGQWSDECFHIFGIAPSLSLPSYKELLRRIQKKDREHFKGIAAAALDDGSDFEIEFRLFLPNGETRWVRALGQPIKNAKGRVIRVHGTVMDVTRRKLVELRQAMEHRVTSMLAESNSPAETMPKVTQTICEAVDWVCGALWVQDKQNGTYQRTATWTLPQPRLEQFYLQSKPFISLPACGGLIGRTLQAGTPIWIEDVMLDPCFPRAAEASEADLHAALAFPIQAGSEILGIMEFFSKRAQNADQEMLQSAHFIGRHIGQFFQRKQAEDALRESEAHFRSLVEQASDSFYMHDVTGRFIDVNQQGCDCLGYTRQELLSMTVMDIDTDMSIGELTDLQNQIAAKNPIALESRYKRKDGTVFPVEIRIGPIQIGGQRHLLALVRDVTERKQLQDHVQHLAYHDGLTGLPNRAMFNRHLSHAITQAQRHEKKLAVLFIDLDRFKIINDTLGHDAGDLLLQEVARRIRACLRENDMVARLGGDEFVVLIEEVHDLNHAAHVARKILPAMVQGYPLGDQLIHITASIGVSTFPEDGSNEFALMKNADIAMYRAKEQGKNNVQFYSTQMDPHSTKLLTLESGLRRALERNELVLHYQAKVETKTGLITGVEALVRWNDPELGLISPAHFIPLAEETGLIVPLSKWVLREACTQNRAWQRQGLPSLHLAVNLSARQFVDDNLLADTMAILHESGMAPNLLELEITESLMMHNTDKTIQTLMTLKALGIRIAIDDFGIGYSSLSHLKQFPIDIIKIDRSFVKDVPGDPADEAIVDAIIAMGKSLKLKLVAEGVETAAQLQFLSERSCDEIQGYYFSPPIPADDFAKLMSSKMASRLSR